MYFILIFPPFIKKRNKISKIQSQKMKYRVVITFYLYKHQTGLITKISDTYLNYIYSHGID